MSEAQATVPENFKWDDSPRQSSQSLCVSFSHIVRLTTISPKPIADTEWVLPVHIVQIYYALLEDYILLGINKVKKFTCYFSGLDPAILFYLLSSFSILYASSHLFLA